MIYQCPFCGKRHRTERDSWSHVTECRQEGSAVNQQQRTYLITLRVILAAWSAVATLNAGFVIDRLIIGWYVAAAFHAASITIIYSCWRWFLRSRLRAAEKTARQAAAIERTRRIAELEKELGIS